MDLCNGVLFFLQTLVKGYFSCIVFGQTNFQSDKYACTIKIPYNGLFLLL